MRSSAELPLALAFALAAGAAGAEERCAPCHASLREPRLRDPATALAASAHGGPLVGCAGCHGGRPAEATAAAHDPAAGFLARPSPADAAERCGACHADARFIRRASATLPTDQLALFRADGHGRAVAAGNPRAPSCVACHSAHDVRPVADPASRAHPSRVADTCAPCHARAARPAGDPPAAWRASVHGRGLHERGNAQAPSCAGCHGAHGEFREAGGADGRCGACHRDEAEAFARSPHAAPFARLGFGGCAQCHGGHGVVEAGGGLLGNGGAGVCARCHGAGQPAVAAAGRLDAARALAQRALDDADDALRRADRAGFAVPEAAVRVEEARAARLRLDVALHTLDEARARDAVREVTRPAEAARDAVRRSLSRRERQRRAALPAAGVFLLLGALLALRSRAAGTR